MAHNHKAPWSARDFLLGLVIGCAAGVMFAVGFLLIVTAPARGATVKLDPGDPGLIWIKDEGFRPADGIDLYMGGKGGKYTCPAVGPAWKHMGRDSVERATQCDEPPEAVVAPVEPLKHFYPRRVVPVWTSTPDPAIVPVLTIVPDICCVIRTPTDDPPGEPPEGPPPVPVAGSATYMLLGLGLLALMIKKGVT